MGGLPCPWPHYKHAAQTSSTSEAVPKWKRCTMSFLTMPTPMLKVRNISDSGTLPACTGYEMTNHEQRMTNCCPS